MATSIGTYLLADRGTYWLSQTKFAKAQKICRLGDIARRLERHYRVQNQWPMNSLPNARGKTFCHQRFHARDADQFKIVSSPPFAFNRKKFAFSGFGGRQSQCRWRLVVVFYSWLGRPARFYSPCWLTFRAKHVTPTRWLRKCAQSEMKWRRSSRNQLASRWSPLLPRPSFPRLGLLPSPGF